MTAASGEDITLATRWIIERMDQHQEERRGWHEAALAQNEVGSANHDKAFRRLTVIAMLRPIIELAILIVLMVKL
jgi:hypothetical protein